MYIADGVYQESFDSRQAVADLGRVYFAPVESQLRDGKTDEEDEAPAEVEVQQ